MAFTYLPYLLHQNDLLVPLLAPSSKLLAHNVSVYLCNPKFTVMSVLMM